MPQTAQSKLPATNHRINRKLAWLGTRFSPAVKDAGRRRIRPISSGNLPKGEAQAEKMKKEESSADRYE
jgi:hypothetical protein